MRDVIDCAFALLGIQDISCVASFVSKGINAWVPSKLNGVVSLSATVPTSYPRFVLISTQSIVPANFQSPGFLSFIALRIATFTVL